MSGPVPLCGHIRENGVFCGRPALHQRHYCYQHLRLRGQQMRMARALAQRQPYRLNLPPLDDVPGVQAALDQVTRAMGLGLLEQRRAGMLLYALRQASCNLRFLAQAERHSACSFPAGEKAVASQPAVTAPQAAAQLRLVEEYPGFEAEFGLPAGLDLSLPPDVVFPSAQPAAPSGPTAEVAVEAEPLRRNLWNKEAIELEELAKQRANLSEKSYAERVSKVNDRMWKQAQGEVRKRQEAEWEAEAQRRNAAEEEKDRQWRSMDEAQRRAFLLGRADGHEAGRREAEAAARGKKPAAPAPQTPTKPTAAELDRA
jgi:hypothetical protein